MSDEKGCAHENVRLHADVKRIANRVYPGHCKDCGMALSTAMLVALVLREQHALAARIEKLEARTGTDADTR